MINPPVYPPFFWTLANDERPTSMVPLLHDDRVGPVVARFCRVRARCLAPRGLEPIPALQSAQSGGPRVDGGGTRPGRRACRAISSARRGGRNPRAADATRRHVRAVSDVGRARSCVRRGDVGIESLEYRRAEMRVGGRRFSTRRFDRASASRNACRRRSTTGSGSSALSHLLAAFARSVRLARLVACASRQKLPSGSRELLSRDISTARYVLPEATFLAWIDCNKLRPGLESGQALPQARPSRRVEPGGLRFPCASRQRSCA